MAPEGYAVPIRSARKELDRVAMLFVHRSVNVSTPRAAEDNFDDFYLAIVNNDLFGHQAEAIEDDAERARGPERVRVIEDATGRGLIVQFAGAATYVLRRRQCKPI